MSTDHTIPVLAKALNVICSLTQGEGAATTKELSQRLDIPASTCYRILRTFAAFDWLRPTAGGRFEFSLGLLPLLRPLSNYQRMFDHFRDPLEWLAQETQISAKVSIKQGINAVTVFRVESPRMVAPSTKVGTAFPLVLGSSGACLLSALDDKEIASIIEESPEEAWQFQTPEDVWRRVREVRAQHTCFDAGSYHAKVNTISAPIRRGKDEVFAVVTILGWPEDFDEARLEKLRAAVSRAANQCATLIKSE